jgi:carotenoid 1,2-hydratase
MSPSVETPDAAPPARGFGFRSSLAADVWHADAGAAAYEWWYFDALSDDGREALVVIFLSNFVFSPRYNRSASARGVHSPGDTAGGQAPRFPALAFFLYRDGRPLLRVVNEYAAGDFEAGRERPACRVGRSEFRYEGAAGGRFVLDIDEPLRGDRRLNARLTWGVLEGDLTGGKDAGAAPREGSHEWNVVAPRCRVEGEMRVSESKTGRVISSDEFRGAGYHDHNRDRRWLPATVESWQWGRAHFDGATAVFYRYRERGEARATTRLFLVRGGALEARDAEFSAGRARRDIFGLSYPSLLRFGANGGDNVSLAVTQTRVLDRSYFYLRFSGEAALALGGRTLRAPAITEHLAPRALLFRALDWLTDMRIGRGGRAAFLK